MEELHRRVPQRPFRDGRGPRYGLILDSIAEELNALVDQADEAAVSGRKAKLSKPLIAIARKLLFIRPFVPGFAEMPENWEDLLTAWVSGEEVLSFHQSRRRKPGHTPLGTTLPRPVYPSTSSS